MDIPGHSWVLSRRMSRGGVGLCSQISLDRVGPFYGGLTDDTVTPSPTVLVVANAVVAVDRGGTHKNST